jgi:carboxylesterase type B
MSIALGAGFGPVLDGDDLPAHPGKAVEAGEAADVPLMIGTTFDEATLFLAGEPALSDPALMSDDDLDTRAQMFGDRAPTLLAAYRASRPDATPIDLLLALQTDATMRDAVIMPTPPRRDVHRFSLLASTKPTSRARIRSDATGSAAVATRSSCFVTRADALPFG